MIRSGNPEFASLSQKRAFKMSCVVGHLAERNITRQDMLDHGSLSQCLTVLNLDTGRSQDQALIQGFGYALWAGYQLLVVIVLLSVLRARMINTYQNIRKVRKKIDYVQIILALFPERINGWHSLHKTSPFIVAYKQL